MHFINKFIVYKKNVRFLISNNIIAILNQALYHFNKKLFNICLTTNNIPLITDTIIKAHKVYLNLFLLLVLLTMVKVLFCIKKNIKPSCQTNISMGLFL